MILACLFAFILVACQAQPMIDSKSGPIEGVMMAKGKVEGFYGIPYAEPPVGDLRFQMPIYTKGWTSTYFANDSLAECEQQDFLTFNEEGSEDCLHLDITRPAGTKPGDNLPVLFWIYGGGFSFGNDDSDGFHGWKWSEKYNVIIVTVNYRLGPLGFLSHKWLRSENSYGSTGNYGVQDQRLGMQWINDNAYQIGADRSRITIFGQSAGAFSVCFHMTSEASYGLFTSAIMESGTCDAPEFFPYLIDAENWSSNLMRKAGCDDNVLTESQWKKCIRDLTPKQLNPPIQMLEKKPMMNNTHAMLYPVMPWSPTVDATSVGLKNRPMNVIKNKAWAKVPVMLGSSTILDLNEGGVFVPLAPLVVSGVGLPLKPEDLDLTLNYFFNNTEYEDKIKKTYPSSNYEDLWGQLEHILTDYFFTCSAFRIASAVSDQQYPAYLYHFTYPWLGNPMNDVHGVELHFVWDQFTLPKTHKEKEMLEAFQNAWYHFAADGAPGNTGGVDWPKYNTTTRSNIVMTIPTQLQTQLDYDKCEMFQTIPRRNPYTWHTGPY